MIRRRVGWAIAFTTTDLSDAWDFSVRSRGAAVGIVGIFAN
jgi:hypothetical protein